MEKNIINVVAVLDYIKENLAEKLDLETIDGFPNLKEEEYIGNPHIFISKS